MPEGGPVQHPFNIHVVVFFILVHFICWYFKKMPIYIKKYLLLMICEKHFLKKTFIFHILKLIQPITSPKTSNK